jgi:hypothetical protein
VTLASLATYWNTTGSNTPSVSLLTPIPEQPWNGSQFGLDAANYYTLYGGTTIGAGSGGASSAAVCAAGYNQTTGACNGTPTGYPKPSWQTGVNGTKNDGVRDMPDVSLFAADGPNYSLLRGLLCRTAIARPNASGSSLYQITGVGGTSAAAPTFAAIMALVNQQYGPQGQANYVLYPLKTQYPAAFHDVTVGTNSVPCNTNSLDLDGSVVAPLDCIAAKTPITITDPNYGVSVVEGELGTGSTADYNAAAGYNLATGLGSVDASALISRLEQGHLHHYRRDPDALLHLLYSRHRDHRQRRGNRRQRDAHWQRRSDDQQHGARSSRDSRFYTLTAGAFSADRRQLPAGRHV